MIKANEVQDHFFLLLTATAATKVFCGNSELFGVPPDNAMSRKNSYEDTKLGSTSHD